MAEFPYTIISKLIIVPVVIDGPLGLAEASFVLDTGASFTIVAPEIVDTVGYSPREGSGFSTIQSPIGMERGYRLPLQSFTSLGVTFTNFEVACHDVGEQIKGLLGMNFLEQFRFCIFPDRKVIQVNI